jgi:hypothetical protein
VLDSPSWILVPWCLCALRPVMRRRRPRPPASRGAPKRPGRAISRMSQPFRGDDLDPHQCHCLSPQHSICRTAVLAWGRLFQTSSPQSASSLLPDLTASPSVRSHHEAEAVRRFHCASNVGDAKHQTEYMQSKSRTNISLRAPGEVV